MVTARRTYAFAAALALSSAPLVAQTYPTGKDPRDNLKPGLTDAGVAMKGMKKVSFTPKAAAFDTAQGLTFVNSDMAFGNGRYVYQGNFSGFSIWDVGNPAKPVKLAVVSCATSQGDPTIIGNLLFLSAEGGGNRKDCAKGGVKDPSEHMAGVRIFDVSNPRAPKLVKNVETCKGSHTHTLIPSPTDKNIVYLYVSGSQGARAENDLPGCKTSDDPADESNSMYRLDVIKVPLNNPTAAEVVTGARIFTNMVPAPRAAGRPNRGGGRGGRGGDTAAFVPPPPTGPRNCHDVTAYPAMNLLAGACGSYGLLVDVSNPEKPVRLDAASDTNFSLWHTAVFSNDGKKIVFTDEYGGGTSPMCQKSTMMEMGGNTTLTITADKKLVQGAYFKIPTAQSAQENCVSHNGGLIPVPGRDIMVQGWYQGGVNVIDFTDAKKPVELAFFDRGSIDLPPPRDSAKGVELNAGAGPANAGISRTRGTIGGSWGAYYWNGYIYSSEMARGLDILELTPGPGLSANEIAAAKLVRFNDYNPQSQPKITWPAAFPVVRSYLDQLVRDKGLAAARTTAIRAALAAAEKQTGAARGAALTKLAGEVDKDVDGAKDSAKVQTMSEAIKALAAVSK
jgi:hypothetical protein